MTEKPSDQKCPTCDESGFESAGEDVARCLNCGFLWVLPGPEPAPEA